ncbi:MAG: prepilin-type N-terminal cleavage/methylation domain-containing protein [bacterium]
MRKIKGFTLTEMVIAIVALGVIASIAVPKYLAVRNSAREAVKTSAINTVRTAITMLYARNRDYPTNAQIVSLLAIGEDTQHNKKLEAEAVNNGIKLQIGITGDNYVVETFTDAKCKNHTTNNNTDKVLCVKNAATTSSQSSGVNTENNVGTPPPTATGDTSKQQSNPEEVCTLQNGNPCNVEGGKGTAGFKDGYGSCKCFSKKKQWQYKN